MRPAFFVNKDNDRDVLNMHHLGPQRRPLPPKSRRQDLIVNLIIGGIFALIIAVLVAPVWWFNAAACSAKWSSVGTTSWGPLQDCIVTLPDGTRRPAVMLRSVDP